MINLHEISKEANPFEKTKWDLGGFYPINWNNQNNTTYQYTHETFTTFTTNDAWLNGGSGIIPIRRILLDGV